MISTGCIDVSQFLKQFLDTLDFKSDLVICKFHKDPIKNEYKYASLDMVRQAFVVLAGKYFGHSSSNLSFSSTEGTVTRP